MEELPKGTEIIEGTVTLAHWTMMPDGETYLHVHARWAILTDGLVAEIASLPGFRSSEKWIAVGYGKSGTNPVVIVPGCQVKGLVVCVGQKPRACYVAHGLTKVNVR